MVTEGELRKKIDRLTEKSRIVIERYALIKQQRDAALTKVADLEKSLGERDLLISELQRQVEFLKVATLVAPDREEVKNARAILSEMVRDIDKCIVELSDP